LREFDLFRHFRIALTYACAMDVPVGVIGDESLPEGLFGNLPRASDPRAINRWRAVCGRAEVPRATGNPHAPGQSGAAEDHRQRSGARPLHVPT